MGERVTITYTSPATGIEYRYTLCENEDGELVVDRKSPEFIVVAEADAAP
jgi:hypothetical protein